MDIGGVRDEGTSTGKNDGRSSADGMNRGSRSHLKTMLAFTS
jgi:hypothetical protein